MGEPLTFTEWKLLREIEASISNRSSSDASANLTPTALDSDKTKSVLTGSPEPSNPPKGNINRKLPNPFNSTWALVKQYASYCFPGDSPSTAFSGCPLLTKLWQCCDAICEAKVRYRHGASGLGYMDNKCGEVMAHFNELCSLICPPEAPFFTASAPPSLPGIFGTIMALRLAVTQLVQITPMVRVNPDIEEVRDRFQLVNQLWHLRVLPQLGSGCGALCDAKQSGCRDLLQRHGAVLDAVWSLLYSAFMVISTTPETLDASSGGVCSFTVRRNQEGEAFEACWRVCEILKTVVVDSVWSKNGEGDELYSQLYSPSVQPMIPTGTELNSPNFEGQQSGKDKKVTTWSQLVEATREKMDAKEAEGADHSDNESTHTRSDGSGEKGSADWTILPVQPVLDSEHWASVTEPTIASEADAVAPKETLSSPASWDEMVAPPIQEGLVASQGNTHDLWQQKVDFTEFDATTVKRGPAVNKNQDTSSSQLPGTVPASTPSTQPAQVGAGSKSSDANAPGPQKQSQRRPSSLPAKPPPVSAATPTPPPSSGAPGKTVSTCTRCSTIDVADIEAIHYIRIRILLLHAATTRGYSSGGGRKFADFVREMPTTSFGETKAQKKLFNSYRRAVLYSTEGIKAKGDTVAHEANVMQVKAAVEWKTQNRDGKYMFLRELYKHVVGVEIEKMEELPEKTKATMMIG